MQRVFIPTRYHYQWCGAWSTADILFTIITYQHIYVHMLIGKYSYRFSNRCSLNFLSYTIPWFYEKYVKSIILYFSLRLIIIDVDTYVILNVTRNLIGPNSIYAELLEETERSRFWKLPTIHQIIISCIATTKLWQIKKKGINEWILLA